MYTHMYVYACMYLSIYLSISTYLYLSISIYLSIYLSICIFIYIYIHTNIHEYRCLLQRWACAWNYLHTNFGSLSTAKMPCWSRSSRYHALRALRWDPWDGNWISRVTDAEFRDVEQGTEAIDEFHDVRRGDTARPKTQNHTEGKQRPRNLFSQIHHFSGL